LQCNKYRKEETDIDSKRIKTIRMYMSQGSRSKRNKNMNILKKNGDYNVKNKYHPKVYPIIFGKEVIDQMPATWM
jgi:hypothetical protein